MTEHIVADYLGRIFEFDTDIYAEFGIDEELAIKLAQCGIFPDDLRALGVMPNDYVPPALQDFNFDYISTKYGYLPSQRQKVVIPKPLRRKGKR